MRPSDILNASFHAAKFHKTEPSGSLVQNAVVSPMFITMKKPKTKRKHDLLSLAYYLILNPMVQLVSLYANH